MDTIPFVKPQQAELAREIERKLMALSKSSGVVFAGVEVTPTEPGEVPVYRLLVGVDREIAVEQAVGHLVTLTLSEELLTGADIQVEIRRGCTRG